MSSPSSSLPSMPPWAKKRPAAAASESETTAAAAAAQQLQQDDERVLPNDDDADADADANNSNRTKSRVKKKTNTTGGDGSSKQNQKINTGKRPRQNGHSSSISPSSRRQRPPPPPAPPAVLVQLLQSDRSVLDYFQSLQVNLQADVQIWKDRVQTHEKDKKRLERQVRKLQKEQQQQQQNGGTAQNHQDSNNNSRVNKKKKTKNGKQRASSSPSPPVVVRKYQKDTSPSALDTQAVDAVDATNNTSTTNFPTAAGLHQEGVPIEDNMFDFDDDDSDDDNDDDERDHSGKPQAHPTTKRNDDAHEDTTKKRAGLFEFENADDSSSDDDNDVNAISSKQNNKRWLIDDKNAANDNGDWLQQEQDEPEMEKEHVRQLLTEAYHGLERLGVSLVDVNVVMIHDVEDNNNLDARTQQPESHGCAVLPDTPVVATATVALDVDDCDSDDENKEQQQQQQQKVATTSTLQQQQQPPRVVVNISPRTNEQVAADLLFALKSLSRIQMLDSELMQSYPPFETKSGLLVPACNHHDASSCSNGEATTTVMTNPLECSEQKPEQQQQDHRPPHPLTEGKLLAFRAMLIIDTYCSPDMTDSDWDSYFVDVKNDNNDDKDNTRGCSNKMEEMRIGLRGRKQWVQQLVDSLHGEIANFWAMQDRSLRLTTTALHFDPPADDKNHNEENGVNDGTTQCNGSDAGASLPLDKKNPDEATTKIIIGGSKSQARLSTLLERVCLCQLVVGFYLSRNDPQAVAGLIRSYLLSTAPSVLSSENENDEAEDYPKLPPVQSLVLMEAMFLPDAQMLWWLPASHTNNDNDLLSSILDLVASLVVDDVSDGDDESTNLCTRTLVSTVGTSFNSASAAGVSLCIYTTASVWKQRLASCDDRIHDLSRVELAAYKRILASKQAALLGLKECMWSDSRLQQELADYYKVISTQNGTLEKDTIRAQGNFGHQLSLIVENRLSGALPLSCFQRNDVNMVALRRVLVSRSIALRQLCIRRLDLYRAKIGPATSTATSSNSNELIVSCRYMYDQIYSEPVKEESKQLRLLSATLECCTILADGDTAFRCSWRLMELLTRNQSTVDTAQRRAIFDLFRLVGHRPLIRVINLERRKDRMRSFLCQCMAHEILVVQAVVDLNEPPARAIPENDSAIVPEDGYYFGRHAIDGGGRMVEAHERLVQAAGMSRLNSLFGAQWCPNDLKAFDRDAPNDERLVRMSCSECACALSHIASWKGVLRSLVLPPMDISSAALLERRDRDTNNILLSYPDRLRRVFRISGFASGPAMHAQNNGMHPAPVCVVLEDDAILVDRFVDRLQALLLELPRDFHFCSLGYSRPKTAPIVPYTRNQRNHKNPCILGIPTNLFYLTGYILSQAGAEYLLSNLPVVGPVDSWIGLKMTSNWDNVYGHVLGVGSHANLSSAATAAGANQQSSTNSVPIIAHKDLCQILNFRAFCAMQPLCSQRMIMGPTGSAAAVSATTGRSWRQRDTDIEYSG